MHTSYLEIVLEGTDGVGKSTIAPNLEYIGYRVWDRHPNISNNIVLPERLTQDHIRSIRYEIESNPQRLYVFIIADTDDPRVVEDINKSLYSSSRHSDTWDKDWLQYNKSYKIVSKNVSDLENVLIIRRERNTTPFDSIQSIIRRTLSGIDYEELPITIEGESKIYRRVPGLKLAFATLKPYLYSFTYKRYQEVPESDVVRNEFWRLLGEQMNKDFSMFMIGKKEFEQRLVNYLG